MLTKWNIGYDGNDVVGNIINTIPPTIPPVAKNTFPTLSNLFFANELNNPAYNSKLQ